LIYGAITAVELEQRYSCVALQQKASWLLMLKSTLCLWPT